MLISPVGNHQNGYNTTNFGKRTEKLIKKILDFKGYNEIFSRTETEKVLRYIGFEPALQTGGSHFLWFRGQEFFSFATKKGLKLHYKSIQFLQDLLKANGF